MVKGEFSML